MPFGPTMPTRSPGETTSETPSSTCVAAYHFETLCATNDGTGRTSLIERDERSWFRSRSPSWRGPRGPEGMLATLPGRHGRPEEEDVEGTPRPAPRAALDRVAARQHVPAVRLAQARAPRLPDLRHLQGPRGRTSSLPGPVSAPRRDRRALRRQRTRRGDPRRARGRRRRY